ncbi:MAG: glycogen synthase GlgA [Pseudomonadota bacterium]
MTRAVLSVASECAPLVKTGGLADVVGALPAALAGVGWHMRTLVPGYPSVLRTAPGGTTVWTDNDLFGGPAEIRATKHGTLDLLILDAPHLYQREGSIYMGADNQNWADNPERFAALSWVAAALARDGAGGWYPEVVHAHDWQAALTPTYLKAQGTDVACLLTIHNIAFHGPAPADRLGSMRLPPERFTADGLEFYGQINALKAGIVDAQAISTVSPTYARELLDPDFGMGLEGVIATRVNALHGILNGIDSEVWSPAVDPMILPYKTPRGKARNRAALIASFGLEAGPVDGPLCIVVSRLTDQKGLDVLADAVPRLVDAGGMLALLGTGDPALEARFRALAAQYPQVGVRIGYSEPDSHKMFAGADAVLVPSRFEPCGLTQLYGLAYGAIPVVARTGGLADTVIDANELALRSGVATGIKFWPVTADALALALHRLVYLYRDSKTFARIQRNGMAQALDWGPSAAAYAALYARLAD